MFKIYIFVYINAIGGGVSCHSTVLEFATIKQADIAATALKASFERSAARCIVTKMY